MKRPGALLLKICACLILFLTLSGCSIFRPAPRFVLSPQQARKVLREIGDQNSITDTLISSGTIKLKDPSSSSEANFIFVGAKYPIKMKIEITHSWGRPLIHCVLEGQRFRLVDYLKKRVITGSLGNARKMFFLPGHTSIKQIWSIFRGYPEISGHDVYRMPSPSTIALYRKKEEVQDIVLDPESFNPRMVSYPQLKLTVRYLNFMEFEGYRYARKVVVEEPSSEQKMIILIKKIFFNRSVPSHIFRLDIPEGFESLTVQ